MRSLPMLRYFGPQAQQIVRLPHAERRILAASWPLCGYNQLDARRRHSPSGPADAAQRLPIDKPEHPNSSRSSANRGPSYRVIL